MNNSLSHIRTIAKRELGAYFASPVAYVFIVIFLLLAGFFTFMIGFFFERGEASLRDSFFVWHPWLYLFLVPAVGMRLWSEERRQGTLELLMTMPITPWQAIVGKFIASWAFLGLALALTFPVVLTVRHLGTPDMGVIVGSYFGSFLLAGAYLAVTSFTSALTRNQVISFIMSLVVCFFLLLAGWPPVTNFITKVMSGSTGLVDFVSAFSVMTHFEGFQKGVVDLRDLVFFLSVIGFSLFGTAVVLRGLRA
ncbi:MAG: ABC transporter permease [Verrucomicrobia bacterium]|nr:ABC transporter permease [Verrucomicrobiota bacterium]